MRILQRNIVLEHSTASRLACRRRQQAAAVQGEQHFIGSGWTRIVDPTGQHLLFFNHAFQTLAIDALPRNCYLKDGDLLPFDVILCQPDEELETFLGIYD